MDVLAEEETGTDPAAAAWDKTSAVPNQPLRGLVLLAQCHGVAADAEQIRHEFGLGSEPFDEPSLLLAARKLGLKAKLLSQPADVSVNLPWMALRSPANGTVQQLAVHTVGVVVTPAQPLLSVVPEDESLEVEVTILNKDIGFIRSGQDAVVKVDSFPYTRYGHIEGRVENVSHDTIQDEKLGLVYQGRVALAKNSLLVVGTKVKLTPGMSLSVEIMTDRRRVIDYLLSPLQQEAQESMQER